MSVALTLHIAGYVACGLCLLYGLWGLWRWRTTSPLWAGLAPFGVLLVLETNLQPEATFGRLFGYLGGLGAYATLLRAPRARLQTLLRGIGIALAIATLCEVALIRQRPSFLANPNMVGAWLLLLWPWMPAPLAALAILATQSRTALAGLAVSFVAQQLQRVGLSPTARLVLVVGVFLFTPWLAWLRPATVADRAGTYLLALQLTAERPLFGWGPGTFWAATDGRSQHADSAPLTISAEMGLAGLALAGGLAVAVWRRGRASTSAARWALLALAIQNIADDTWLWPWTILLAAANLALLEETHNGMDTPKIL